MRKWIVTVDPGWAGTGICVWPISEFMSNKCIPIDAKNYYPARMKQEKFNQFIQGFGRLMNDTSIVYIERPHFMESSAKGIASAREGGLMKLGIFAGTIQGIALISGAKVEWVEISRWKGTLDKKIVKSRIKKIWPGCHYKAHSIDAVGIGFHIMGLF